ncbi:hypothetical protein GALMADRAFT_138136 [Galerina marginata CBS 339.88]|uniref:Uncharacterized protein n=1 Tax=Galerina marginata (strain CBS 339.88) TaxID=685588 RepID=A0A067TGA7_GALM3|nr:hypothetical protein GALMADRAFT_138136 [Galerina marginata CBS 339.88]
MGCILSIRPEDAAKARNDEVEDQLKRDCLTAMNEINMLLVGVWDSGMATIVKQMKLVHYSGCSDSERFSFKGIICADTIQFMRTILNAMLRMDLYPSPENDAHCALIFSLPQSSDIEFLPRDVANALLSLWKDDSVQEAVSRSNEFDLHESAIYYMNSIDRIASPSYIPTDEDILRRSVKTSIAETTFRTGELTYKLYDADAQKGARRKWIHSFEGVMLPVVVISLKDYGRTLLEDGSLNVLQNLLDVFDSICNTWWFRETSVILFLNDADIFAGNLSHSPLQNYFPDYRGGDDYEAACEYLLQRFTSLNRRPETRQIYTHFTSVMDTQQFQFIVNAVQDIRIRRSLAA